MTSGRMGIGAATALAALLAVWACNGDATSGDVGNLGGAGGQAGEVGSGGESCGPLALTAVCDPSAEPGAALHCPASPSEVVPWCSAHGATVSYPSSCGGVSIVVEQGLGVTDWHFSANGELVGVERTDDVPVGDGACADTFHVVYGAACKPTGPGNDLCNQDAVGGAGGNGGAGGAH